MPEKRCTLAVGRTVAKRAVLSKNRCAAVKVHCGRYRACKEVLWGVSQHSPLRFGQADVRRLLR